MKILRNNRGFSLVEVMVSLGIMAVIGAIAVPQFTKYRRTAAYTAKGQSLKNIARAANVCIAANGYKGCDTMSKIGMSELTGGESSDQKDALCTDTEETIAGEVFKACISISASGSTSTTTNKRFCFKDVVTQTPACGAGYKNGYDDTDANTRTATASCKETLELARGPCTSDADCKTGDTCQPTANESGECTVADGTCA